MIIFYGDREIKRIVAKTAPQECEICHTTDSLQIQKTARWFTLFWIPIVPLSASYTLVCPTCGLLAELDKGKAKEMIKNARQ